MRFYRHIFHKFCIVPLSELPRRWEQRAISTTQQERRPRPLNFARSTVPALPSKTVLYLLLEEELLESMLPWPLSGESRFLPGHCSDVRLNEASFMFSKLPLSFFITDSLSLSEPEDDELEQLLLSSDWSPVVESRSTRSAISATSGRSSRSVLYHCLESFGRPRTVLCHTMGKFVELHKRSEFSLDHGTGISDPTRSASLRNPKKYHLRNTYRELKKSTQFRQIIIG